MDENQKVLINDRMTEAYVSKDHSPLKSGRVIRGRLPLLELVHEKFIMDLFPKLTAFTGKPVRVWMLSTDLLSFGELANKLKIPTLIQNMESENFKSSFAIATDYSLFNALSSVILGGQAEKTISRPYLTNTDLKIAKDLSQLFLGSINNAFQRFYGDLHKDFTMSNFDSNPQFWGLCAPSDIVITTTFEAEIDGYLGQFQIVFPHQALSVNSPVSFSSSFQRENKTIKKAFRLSKESLFAEIASEIPLEEMTVKQVRELKVGDILKFKEINENTTTTTTTTTIKKGV